MAEIIARGVCYGRIDDASTVEAILRGTKFSFGYLWEQTEPETRGREDAEVSQAHPVPGFQFTRTGFRHGLALAKVVDIFEQGEGGDPRQGYFFAVIVPGTNAIRLSAYIVQLKPVEVAVEVRKGNQPAEWLPPGCRVQ